MSEPRIVAGTDCSEPAAHAVSWAAEEAARRGAALEVVYAWLPEYPITASDLLTDYGPMEQASEAMLAAAVTRLQEEVPQVDEVGHKVVLDHPATALIREARGAELLVVGSRGRGGFVGLRLGSVSQRCVVHAPCPVAVVPATWSSADPPSRVVVGVDGSEQSHEALIWAAQAALLRDARLSIIHAWGAPEIVVPDGAPFLADPEALERASRSLLENMAESLEDQLDGKPPEVELWSVPGPPAHALVQAARGADLLVVGARGLGGFRRWLLGSVSQQCTHHAPCPTVIVHRPSSEDKP